MKWKIGDRVQVKQYDPVGRPIQDIVFGTIVDKLREVETVVVELDRGESIEIGEESTALTPAAQVAALREALREWAITSETGLQYRCLMCNWHWNREGREQHKEGCLAALTATSPAQPCQHPWPPCTSPPCDRPSTPLLCVECNQPILADQHRAVRRRHLSVTGVVHLQCLHK